ncbi:MAG: cytochrome c family protein [Alphaproteobacteria bacterium]|nr:cytochrome c family protein [Alphaproteobacteria bacterium]
MNSFQFNKIFAAVLVAGITAMLSGFISGKLVHAENLEQDAVPIVVAEAATSGAGEAKAAGPEAITGLLATADVTKGEKLSKACAACHSFDKGGPDKVGPNLWGVVGGPKAHKADFAYSSGMAKKGGNWDYASLNEFLWKPKNYVKGTKMSYAGLKKTQDRADIIAWLRTLSDSPVALPSAAEVEAAAPVEEEAPTETLAE